MAKKVSIPEYDLQKELGETLCIEGIVHSKVSEDYNSKFFKLKVGEELFRCMIKNKFANIKRGNSLKVSGTVVELEENGKINYYIETDKIIDSRFVSLQGIESLTFNGHIVNSSIKEETETFFTVSSQNDELYPCFYEKAIELIEGDKVICEGHVKNEGGYHIVHINSMTVRANFDVCNFVAKFLSDKNSNFINNALEKTQEYSSFTYGSSELCFQICSKDLETFEKREILLITEYVFDKLDFSKMVESMMYLYRKDYIYRPFAILGILRPQVDEMEENGRDLNQIYQLIFENPARIPELKKEQVDSFFYSIFYRFPTREEDSAGAISRYIYQSIKMRKWTSIPIWKIEKTFPLSFSEMRNILEQYDCKEHMNCIYFSPFLSIEKFVAEKISSLMSMKIDYNPELPADCSGKILSDDQKKALYGSLQNGISIITGAAGTGKTKILSDIGEILVQDGFRPLYVAYVGAAVQRIKAGFSEKTNEILKRIKIGKEQLGRLEDKIDIMTIHLAIARSKEIVNKNITHVIFDECSMIDINLLYQFMKSMNRIYGLKYIFVGDINQLEPIAPGNIMNQLLKCGVKVFKLTENYRNEKGILELVEEIIDERRIAEFRPIRWSEYQCREFEFRIGGIQTMYDKLEDLSYILSDEEFKIRRKVIEFLDNITIVTYYKETCKVFNRMVQQIFLNGFKHIVINGEKYYEHDRMMNLKNNYNMNIMNGEIGKIIELNRNFIGIRYKDTQDCVYFSHEKHALYKKIVKMFKIGYSFLDANIKEKPRELIVHELTKECEKLLSTLQPSQLLEYGSDISDFFEVSKRYTRCIFGDKEMKCAKLMYATQAYCMTIRKAQGSQFPICICFHDEKTPYYINRRSTYTELSRAKKRLILIAPSEEKMNVAILNPDPFVYDNLANNIIQRLPQELKPEIPEISEQIDISEMQYDDEEGMDDAFDAIDLDDIY